MNPPSVIRWILLLLTLALVLVARCWNHGQIFVDGQIYFVDADCYSRMTRVQAVLAHPGLVLRHHDFENWPDGTTPHTTVPLDYFIAALAVILRPLARNAVDLAGAWSGLLLAAATAVVLWKWASQFRLLTQIAVLLLFAVSPILVHGQVLGRPDHQSLLIFLIATALATERGGAAWKKRPRLLPLLHGLAWGLALWTSLFEPVILLAIFTAASLAVQRRTWFTRQRGLAWLTLGSVLLVALLIEHWRLRELPGGELFDRWSRSIGELTRPGPFSPVFLHWLGLGFLAAPAILVWRLWREKLWSCLPWTALLLATWLLSATMLRWGYFLALAFLFGLPFLLEKIRSRWVAGLLFLTLWPVAGEWDRMLDSRDNENTAGQIDDERELRLISGQIKNGAVLAPWWLSPPIAYWSGANCVAGSSHQSLPGIADTAAFYLTRDPAEARTILRRRQVRWVLADAPDRVLTTSAALLARPAANDSMDALLDDFPRRVPAFLQLRAQTASFKLYEFLDGP